MAVQRSTCVLCLETNGPFRAAALALHINPGLRPGLLEAALRAALDLCGERPLLSAQAEGLVVPRKSAARA
jgi:hypothetical protein